MLQDLQSEKDEKTVPCARLAMKVLRFSDNIKKGSIDQMPVLPAAFVRPRKEE